MGKKKHVKLFIFMIILYVIAVIAIGMFALLETGVPRTILVILTAIAFFCGITQFLLYQYLSQHKSKESRGDF